MPHLAAIGGNCGVSGHGLDCLCDVVIEKPALIRYFPSHVWHADIIARSMNYSEQTATPATTADFLETLAKAYDATRHLVGADIVFVPGRCDQLRGEITVQLAEGESIIDLPEILGESFARILAAITRGHPHQIWMWGDKEWLELEDLLNTADAHSGTDVALAMGLPRSQYQMCEALIEMYGKATNAAQSRERKAKIDEIIERYHELPFKSLMAMVRAAGLQYGESTVKSYRRRHRKSINAPLLPRGKSGNIATASLALVTLGDVLAACPT